MLEWSGRWGRYPAAAALFAFVALELAKPQPDYPRTLAIAIALYSYWALGGNGRLRPRGVDALRRGIRRRVRAALADRAVRRARRTRRRALAVHRARRRRARRAGRSSSWRSCSARRASTGSAARARGRTCIDDLRGEPGRLVAAHGRPRDDAREPRGARVLHRGGARDVPRRRRGCGDARSRRAARSSPTSCSRSSRSPPRTWSRTTSRSPSSRASSSSRSSPTRSDVAGISSGRSDFAPNLAIVTLRDGLVRPGRRARRRPRRRSRDRARSRRRRLPRPSNLARAAVSDARPDGALHGRRDVAAHAWLSRPRRRLRGRSSSPSSR